MPWIRYMFKITFLLVYSYKVVQCMFSSQCCIYIWQLYNEWWYVFLQIEGRQQEWQRNKKYKATLEEGNGNNDNNEEKKQQEQLEKSEKSQLEQLETRAESNFWPMKTTSAESKKRRTGAALGVCAMHKLAIKKAEGKKFKVGYNKRRIPVGDTRHTLHSYIGMCVRTMVPIDIPSWPKVDAESKANIWTDMQV